MNLLFRASDKAFENAVLSDERCDALLANQMRIRRGGMVCFLVVLIASILFIGSLVIGDPFKSPVWQWLFSPDAIHSRGSEIQIGGFAILGLLCGAVGAAIGADHRIKLLLLIRALQERAKQHNQNQ